MGGAPDVLAALRIETSRGAHRVASTESRREKRERTSETDRERRKTEKKEEPTVSHSTDETLQRRRRPPIDLPTTTA